MQILLFLERHQEKIKFYVKSFLFLMAFFAHLIAISSSFFIASDICHIICNIIIVKNYMNLIFIAVTTRKKKQNFLLSIKKRFIKKLFQYFLEVICNKFPFITNWTYFFTFHINNNILKSHPSSDTNKFTEIIKLTE